MAILPDLEYDIFVSYRHNDNRSGWVTEFVNALKEELAATIKEPVSIYFDSNAHDGLLENHNVDKSLEGKLRCAILIPILSQTYCDPRSFAWQHEFVAFNKLAREDRFGRDIRLNNGNVASRILPIKIHDLDIEDQAAIEKETEGALRAIEFIFKSPGVNRPLRSNEDQPSSNQNKTFYRDQINKVANAVKGIVTGLRYIDSPALKPPPTRPDVGRQKTAKPRTKYLVAGVGALVLIATIFIFTRQSISSEGDQTVEKSIAVLPFVNMSNDPDQEYFSDGLSEELLNLLSKVSELKVTGRTSSFSFKGKNEDLRVIAEKLGVANILEGSVRRSGNTLRITAQLINAADGTHLWSETYDRDLDDIFKVQDEIAQAVVSKLKVTLLGNAKHNYTQNTEAYNLYLQGKYFYDRNENDLAIPKFRAAVALDSTFAPAWAYLALATSTLPSAREDSLTFFSEKALRLDPTIAEAYLAQFAIELNRNQFDKAQVLIDKAREADPSNLMVLGGAAALSRYKRKTSEALAIYREMLVKDPLRASTYNAMALGLLYAGRYAEAESAFNKVLELNPSWGSRQNMGLNQLALGKNEAALQTMQQVTIEFWKLQGLALAYAALHNRGESDKALNQLIDKYAMEGAFQIAEVYSFRNEPDLAFKWLEVAQTQHDPGLVDVDVSVLLKPLHNDPRWAPFVDKVEL